MGRCRGLLAFALVGSFISALPAQAATVSEQQAWRQVGYNAQHTSYNNLETKLGASNVARLHQVWTTSIRLSAVVNGVAYGFSISSGPVWPGSTSRIEALNAATGALLWSKVPCRASGVTTYPSFGSGRLWVGVQGGSFGNGIAALNPNGTTALCKHETDRLMAIEETLTPYGGVVFAAYPSGIVQDINASSGELVWQKDFGVSLDTPAVSADGSSVYLSGGTSSLTVFKLAASNGTLLWTARLPDPNLDTSPPTVSGNIVMIGGYSGMYALNAGSGSLIWADTLNSVSPSTNLGCCVTSPTVAGGLVIVGDADGGDIAGIAAFNVSTGALVWNTIVGDGEQGAAVSVANGIVYVADDNGFLDALNLPTGALLASLGKFNQFSGQPIVVNGMVYAASVLGLASPD